MPVLVRIACRELEGFYLGDLAAVERGLGRTGLASSQHRKRYRDPDKPADPSGLLKRITRGDYQHIAGSRSIAGYLSIAENKSYSFRILVEGIRKLATS
ncbi:MAG: DUF4276 family protein [Desulfovibrio sp.]|nr:DUF4276 family protein [Desulfovibrio sp.]